MQAMLVMTALELSQYNVLPMLCIMESQCLQSIMDCK